MKFDFKKLSEIAAIDISSIDKKSKEGEPSVKMCNFTDVYYKWAVTKEMESDFLVATASEQNVARFLLKKGQVAITKDSETRDDIGIPTYIADDFADTVLGYHCALITPNPQYVNGKYLNAYLASHYGRKYFANQASGSGQRYTLTLEAIGSVVVALPDLKTQEMIGNIFSNIDRKIFNNNKVNVELESMAKTLYDYWFLQFEFPNEEGKPYKSSGGKMVWNEDLKREIPEGWESKKVGEIVTFENGDRGKNYPSGDDFKPYGIPFVNGGAMSEGNIDYKSLQYINEEKFDILRAGKAKKEDILLTLRGSIAKCVYSPFDKAAIASALVIIRPREIINNNYLYHFLKSDYFKQICENYNNGSVQANLSVDMIKSFDCVVPSTTILNYWEEFIGKIDKKVELFKKENRELASLRDFLLPLLMNGQVGFKEEA